MSIFISGCASTRIIGPNTPAAEFEKIKRDTQKRDTKMTLSSGETLNARNIQITPDSTTWINSATMEREMASTAEVRQIVVKKSRAIQGGLLGGLAGMTIGAIWASALVSEAEKTDDSGKAFGNLFIEAPGAFIVSTTAGALTGLAIGAGVGSRETYQFTRPEEPSAKGNLTK
jgi:hypothetical protein